MVFPRETPHPLSRSPSHSVSTAGAQQGISDGATQHGFNDNLMPNIYLVHVREVLQGFLLGG